MKDGIKGKIKEIYIRLPFGARVKNRLKNVFYTVFGFAFTDSVSYKVWRAEHGRKERKREFFLDSEEASYLSFSYSALLDEALDHDVISFDIFDTLIKRKISDHHAIIKLVEARLDLELGIRSGLYEKRQQYKKSLIASGKNVDPDLDEIYDDLVIRGILDKKTALAACRAEREAELSLITPGSEMIRLLKSLHNEHKKEVLLISDMQLTRADIEAMLNEVGVERNDYDGLWLSNELKLRKDNKSMWESFLAEYAGKACLHIGDNIISDVMLPRETGIDAVHVMSETQLFKALNVGRMVSLTDEPSFADAIAQGLVINRMCDKPFEYNPYGLRLRTGSAKRAGYSFLGPAILSYVLRLHNEAVRLGCGRIFFLSREGALLKAAYDIISKDTSPASEYLYVSRRALMFASIRTAQDIDRLLELYYAGSFGRLAYERFGIIIEDKKRAAADIKLPDNKAMVRELLKEYEDGIIDRAGWERENYLRYLKGLFDDENKRIMLSDIGYAGTIQYYLSVLTGRGYDGYYMMTDASKRPEAVPGSTIRGCFVDGDISQELSSSALHRYHLVLESVLTAADGQLLYFDDEGSPCFSENPGLTDENLEMLQQGILDYIREYKRLCGSAVFDDHGMANETSLSFPDELLNALVNCPVLRKNVRECFRVDDAFSGGEEKNAIEYYLKRNL